MGKKSDRQSEGTCGDQLISWRECDKAWKTKVRAKNIIKIFTFPT